MALASANPARPLPRSGWAEGDLLLSPSERARIVAAAAKRRRRRGVATAYLFLAPNLALFAAFLVYPVIRLAQQSFESGGVLGPATWVGFRNWAQLFHDPAVGSSIAHTLTFAAMYVPAIIVLALALALLMRRVRRGGAIVRGAVYLPSIAPLVLVGVIWTFMLHPDFGLANILARTAGMSPPDWLGSPRLALPTIAMVEVWRAVGFWAMLLLAALLAIPGELYDAAKIDGASAWQRFRHVTLYAVRPTLIAVVGLALIEALQVFDSVYVLTGGGPAGATQTVALYVYDSIFQSGDPGFGAALSLVLAVTIATGTGIAYAVAHVYRRGPRPALGMER